MTIDAEVRAAAGLQARAAADISAAALARFDLVGRRHVDVDEWPRNRRGAYGEDRRLAAEIIVS
jgi:hypothetical protein